MKTHGCGCSYTCSDGSTTTKKARPPFDERAFSGISIHRSSTDWAQRLSHLARACGMQHPDVKDLLVTHRPVRANGRPKKTDTETVSNGDSNQDRLKSMNSRAYIEQRLSRRSAFNSKPTQQVVTRGETVG